MEITSIWDNAGAQTWSDIHLLPIPHSLSTPYTQVASRQLKSLLSLLSRFPVKLCPGAPVVTLIYFVILYELIVSGFTDLTNEGSR